MNNYKFILEPYNTMKTIYHCPKCNKRTFTRYIDTDNNEYVNNKVGRCSRLIKCNYHYTPKSYFNDNDIITTYKKKLVKKHLKPKPKINFINFETLKKSIETTQTNYFLDFLASIWDYNTAYFLAEKYNIGTSKYWNGATVFWQVDINGNIRSGKIMLYNAINGKRVKKPFNHINWVHKVLGIEDYNLEQCYFGEHLLNEDLNKPVAIVESEKTAIISSILLPEFIWLACGSVNNLNLTKTEVLKGRNVVLFPDLKCYDLWNDKIPKLTKLATFTTSTLLKNRATKEEKEQGLDIVDFMLRLDLK